MTTYASAPGTRLGGRYRLEDRIAAGSGWDAWKAIDETLARAVTVFTFASGFPRVPRGRAGGRRGERATCPAARAGLRCRRCLGPCLHRDGVGGRRDARGPAVAGTARAFPRRQDDRGGSRRSVVGSRRR